MKHTSCDFCGKDLGKYGELGVNLATLNRFVDCCRSQVCLAAALASLDIHLAQPYTVPTEKPKVGFLRRVANKLLGRG